MATERQEFWKQAAREESARPGHDVAAGFFALLAQPNENEVRESALHTCPLCKGDTRSRGYFAGACADCAAKAVRKAIHKAS